MGCWIPLVNLYVCVNCGKLGDITEDFNDECSPGWTHGKLIRVDEENSPALDRLLKAQAMEGSS